MAQIPIPKPWRDKVCAVLKTEATGKLIEWTFDAEQDYEADAAATKARNGSSDYVWKNEVYEPFRQFLSSAAPTGCPVTMRTPPGVTYEFYFLLHGEQYYGKILLRPDEKRILIFSAHRPRKATLSCE